ncbi:tetratricopeptide repeat protein [Microbulbifer sp. CnH-101-E]|uniref:tetratricopeptide repeat protein n=1 Tax=unclassified Microbulbifer TaxID=2619833 RepID=UPI0040395975
MKSRVYCLISFLLLSVLTVSAYARDWREYKSTNFTVYSDVSSKKAEALLRELEKFRSASLMVTGMEDRPENSRLRVYHFNKSREFEKFSGKRSIAGFYINTIDGPLIFSQENKRGILNGQAIMFHEYVHHLMRERGSMRYPRWYSEGFAELLASATIDQDSITIGNFPEWRAYDLEEGPLKAREILQPDYSRKGWKHSSQYYASAWLLLHYLFFSEDARENAYHEKTKKYLADINNGGDPLDLFSQHYDIRVEDLDIALTRYLKERRLSGYKVNLTKNAFKIEKRKLNHNEKSLLLAERAVDLERYDQALSYLNKVKKDAAKLPGVIALKANLLMHNQQEAAAQALLQELSEISDLNHTAATNLSVYHLYSLHDTLESRQWDEGSYTKTVHYADMAIALNLASLSAYQYKWMAQQYKGESVAALKTMMAAYQKNPNSIEINSAIGFHLAKLKKPKLAKPFLERTLAWSHNHKVRSRAKKLLDWVAKETSTDSGVSSGQIS